MVHLLVQKLPMGTSGVNVVWEGARDPEVKGKQVGRDQTVQTTRTHKYRQRLLRPILVSPSVLHARHQGDADSGHFP